MIVLPPDLRPLGIAVSGSTALVGLALLTVRVCRRLYRVSLDLGGATIPLAVCAACGLVGLLVHVRLTGTLALQVVTLMGLEALLASVVAFLSYGPELRHALGSMRAW